MSRDQRAKDNWALLFAQELALKHKAPLAVVFCLVPAFLGATNRPYRFMLKGLQEVEQSLGKKNIPFFLLPGSPEEEIPKFIREHNVSSLVKDFDPLRIKRRWTEAVAASIDIPCYEVDAHNIVPCWIASPKQEYGAYTFRPKIRRLLPEFLEKFPPLREHPFPWEKKRMAHDFLESHRTLKVNTVSDADWIKPGEKEAFRVLRRFVEKKLGSYDTRRNDPSADGQSGLSPYLHFGQISAQRVALEDLRLRMPRKNPVKHSSKNSLFAESSLTTTVITIETMTMSRAFPNGRKRHCMPTGTTKENTVTPAINSKMLKPMMTCGTQPRWKW